MSTSLLYHAFGVRDYRYVKTEYVEGEVIFTMERKTDTGHCAACGSENTWRQGSVMRSFRALPIGRRPRCRNGERSMAIEDRNAAPQPMA